MKKINVKNLPAQIRLDHYLVQTLHQNRSFINQLLEQNLIYINGSIPKKNGQLINNGAIITIDEPNAPSIKNRTNKIKLKIVYEDQDLIVINKPKNIIVHPTSFNETNTVVSALHKKIQINQFPDSIRPGIVHRLDKDTTGLLVIAKNKKTYSSLLKQITNRTLVRKYLALVHHNFSDKYLLVKLPIARSKQNVLKMVVSDDPKAKSAQTEITVLENYHHGALIECRLLSGRTHQIRVHLAHIHHPIFNDQLYGSYDGYKNYGQFLHAYYLSFVHPTKNNVMEFKVKPDNTFNTLKLKLKGAK
jgi:23S rRNA pseudouridine1911/1915/1917 synthase